MEATMITQSHRSTDRDAMAKPFLDCARIAQRLFATVAGEVGRLREDDVPVGLTAVVVGDDAVALADEVELERAACELGIAFESVRVEASASETEVVEIVRSLNEQRGISAITVVGPLPGHVDKRAVCEAIDGVKDVDAGGSHNIGLLATGRPRYLPSAAGTLYEVLDAWIVEQGHDAEDFYRRSRIVVVGGVNDVATAAVLLGCARRAPVASVDPSTSRSAQFGWYTRHADVLVVAAGVPALIRAEHVRDGAIVLDAGRSSIRDADTGAQRIVGDVVVDEVAGRAGAVISDAGGLRRIRVAVLMGNAARAASSAAQVGRCFVGELS